MDAAFIRSPLKHLTLVDVKLFFRVTSLENTEPKNALFSFDINQPKLEMFADNFSKSTALTQR